MTKDKYKQMNAICKSKLPSKSEIAILKMNKNRKKKIKMNKY